MPKRLNIAVDGLITWLSIELSVPLAAGPRCWEKGHILPRKNMCECLSLSKINEDTTDLFLIAFRLLDGISLLRGIHGWCVRGDSVHVGIRNIMVAEYVHCIAY